MPVNEDGLGSRPDSDGPETDPGSGHESGESLSSPDETGPNRSASNGADDRVNAIYVTPSGQLLAVHLTRPPPYVPTDSEQREVQDFCAWAIENMTGPYHRPTASRRQGRPAVEGSRADENSAASAASDLSGGTRLQGTASLSDHEGTGEPQTDAYLESQHIAAFLTNVSLQGLQDRLHIVTAIGGLKDPDSDWMVINTDYTLLSDICPRYGWHVPELSDIKPATRTGQTSVEGNTNERE